MAKYRIMANKWAKEFITAKDKKYALNSIIYNINYLVYSSTKEPLTYQDRSLIFKHIFDIIAGREALIVQDGEQIHPDFSDIIILFERRNFVLKHLKAGIKKQAELN